MAGKKKKAVKKDDGAEKVAKSGAKKKAAKKSTKKAVSAKAVPLESKAQLSAFNKLVKVLEKKAQIDTEEQEALAGLRDSMEGASFIRPDNEEPWTIQCRGERYFWRPTPMGNARA